MDEVVGVNRRVGVLSALALAVGLVAVVAQAAFTVLGATVAADTDAVVVSWFVIAGVAALGACVVTAGGVLVAVRAGRGWMAWLAVVLGGSTTGGPSSGVG